MALRTDSEAPVHPMRSAPPWLALIAVAGLAGCALLGDGSPTLSVLVLDAETGEPLRGSRVTLDGQNTQEADAAGRVQWDDLGAGEHRVEAAAPGWTTAVTVVGGGERSLTLVLQPEPGRAVGGREALDALRDPAGTAVLRRRGFYRRRGNRTGAFFTRAEIEGWGVRTLSDVFGIVSGVQVDRRDGLARVTSNRRRACPLVVFLDGVEAYALGTQIDAVPIDDVAGVEVYRGLSGVPVEFYRDQRARDCGVVLVWTVIVS